MDATLIILRLVHIVLGVFWAGTLIFNAWFLGPAMADAGPDAAKVGAGLMRRRLFDVLPVVGGLTLISGIWLYWRASLGFEPAYVHSPVGMTYAVGGLLAIIGFILGVVLMRPAVLRAARLAQSAASAPQGERELQLALAQQLRVSSARVGRIVAVLLLLSVCTMAVGRYA
jgi:hypothetical protein